MTDQSTAVATIERQPRSVLVDMSTRYGMEPAAFEATLRATVCKGNVGREEFAAFLLVAKEYRLNPLTKEIYAFPAKGGGIQPIVSIDGWCRIINEHPALDGIEFDDQVIDGKLEAVTCRIYRKDRDRPTAVTEYMGECRRATDTWKTWPARMLRHKALIQCARYAFGFSGIVDPDEYERQMAVRDITPREGPNLTARLTAPQEGPREGFTTVHAAAHEDTPDHDAETGEVMDDSFPGDKPSTGESEAAGSAEAEHDDERTDPAAELLEWAANLKADIEGLSLEQIEAVLASPNEQANFAKLEATQAQTALDLNRAIGRRKKELGA